VRFSLAAIFGQVIALGAGFVSLEKVAGTIYSSLTFMH